MRFSTNSNDDEASDAGFAPGVRELDLDALCCPCCLPELHDNNYMALGDEPGGEGGQLGNNRPGKLKSTGPRFLKVVTSEAPGPGKYTPRHTLQDGRTEISDYGAR